MDIQEYEFEKNPLISVIVPVYNVEQYLHRCIDSILAQTYTNLEIILVDDGSPDRSGEICDAYAVQDSRVKAIHQENGGLSAARNAGLDICTGEYITFVDSDDYIEPDMIQTLLHNIKNADMCGCGMFRESSEKGILFKIQPNEEYRLSGSTVLRWRYSGKSGALQINESCIWGKLFRKKLFEQLRFKDGIVFEDIHLMSYLLLSCKEVCHLPYVGYHYIVNPDSITNKKDADHVAKCYQDCFWIWDDHEKLYLEKGMDDLATEVICARIDKIITHMLTDNVPQEYEQWSKQILRQSIIKAKKKPIGKSRKIRYLAFICWEAEDIVYCRKL